MDKNIGESPNIQLMSHSQEIKLRVQQTVAVVVLICYIYLFTFCSSVDEGLVDGII